jgi:hypothetical protein
LVAPSIQKDSISHDSISEAMDDMSEAKAKKSGMLSLFSSSSSKKKEKSEKSSSISPARSPSISPAVSPRPSAAPIPQAYAAASFAPSPRLNQAAFDEPLSGRLESAKEMEDEDDAGECEEERSQIVAAPVAPIQRGTVSEVLQQQKFGGNFALDAAFARVLGASLAALDAALAPARLAPLDGGDVKSVWATLLALAALEKHYGASRGVWEMVAEKAIAWLTTLLKDKGLDKKAARVKIDELVAIAKTTI